MARLGSISDDRIGPVAEMANARAVQRPFSWFKSRPGLQSSLLRSFGWASQQLAKAARTKLDRGKAGSIGGTHPRKCGKNRG